MIINHNLNAMGAHRNMAFNTAQTGKAMEKLSSGLRINRAGDDAAGLAISEKMRGQIRGLDQATRNSQDGISLIQTAEGALNETHSILQRMRELAVQSSNDTNTTADRSEIQKEVEQLKSEITRISTDTEFNTKKLLNGDIGKTITVTGNTFKASNVQAVGNDITTGSYSLSVTAAGTQTVGVGTNTAATGLAAANITVGAGLDFGNYKLTVSNATGTEAAGTADLRLERPDGTFAEVTGVARNGAAVAVGGLTFDFSTNGIDAEGTVNISVTQVGMDVDLTGDKITNTAPINYAGGKVNVGGFEFELKTGSGIANAQTYSMNVNDRAVKFQIGANSNQATTLSVNNMSADGLGVSGVDLTSQSSANNAVTTINTAIEKVSGERSKLGATQNRLEHTINNLSTSAENLQAAESRVRDVDMAKEMMNFTKNNILNQAAQAMMAQSNSQPQAVLQLLR